jgi:hypothetical protein
MLNAGRRNKFALNGHLTAGTRLRHYATSRKVAGLILEEVIGFSIEQSFQPNYSSGVDSASNRNEYQESSFGGGG